MKTITTFTLWYGHLPLIHYIPPDAAKRHRLCHYRIATSTMTQGATPAHIKTRTEAEALASFHAIDGEKLDIESMTLEL